VKIPELPEALSISEPEEVNKIYEDALGLRPEIKSSQLKIQSAQKQIAAARGNYYPTLSLAGNLNTFFTTQNKISTQVLTGNSTAIGFVEGTFQRVLIPETRTEQTKNPYSKQLNQNLSYAVGLTLNVPIFNKFQVQTAVKQSKLQYQNAILTEKQTETDLFNTIQQAYLKAQAAIDNFKAAEKNLETAKKSYDYAIDRLNLGSISQLEVNLAKTNLDNALSKLTQSKYEYLFNTKLLDFYQGKKIEL
jgi:outer membrane protein